MQEGVCFKVTSVSSLFSSLGTGQVIDAPCEQKAIFLLCDTQTMMDTTCNGALSTGLEGAVVWYRDLGNVAESFTSFLLNIARRRYAVYLPLTSQVKGVMDHCRLRYACVYHSFESLQVFDHAVACLYHDLRSTELLFSVASHDDQFLYLLCVLRTRFTLDHVWSLLVGSLQFVLCDAFFYSCDSSVLDDDASSNFEQSAFGDDMIVSTNFLSDDDSEPCLDADHTVDPRVSTINT